MVGAVAQFEREIMLERQREGIARAKAEGKYKGRAPTARAKAEARHNVVNTGHKPLKLCTLYSPPEHRDGLKAATKAEADASTEHFDGKTTE